MTHTVLQNYIHPYYSLTKENKPFECAPDSGLLKHPPEIKKSEISCQDVGKIFPISCQKDLPSTLPSSVTTSTCSPVGFDYPPEYSLSAHSRISDINYATLLNRRQRGEKRPIPEEQKDEKYYERRKRNNEAAKKSRDARKLREDRIAFRAAILEQENAILRAQLVALREEMTTLRQMMGTRPAQISVNL